MISTPIEGGSVSGGTLHIEGYAHAFSSAPVIIELIKQNGAIVASKQMTLKANPSGGDYVAFATDLAYSVTQATPVRLSLRQTDDQKPLTVDVALSSQVITLKP